MAVNNEPVRVVVIGKTGSGKSSVANILLGKEGRFKCGALGSSVTKTTEADEGDCKGNAVKVVDTPGYFDTNVSKEDNDREIIQCLMLSEPGPNLFFYCISIASRFTEEDAESFRRAKQIFGDYVTNYMVIVFTSKDRLDKAGITETDYIVSAPPNLQQILDEVRRKYVFIDSTLKTELDSLSTFIKDLELNTYYTDEKYCNAINTLKRLVEAGGEFTKAETELTENRKKMVKFLSDLEICLNKTENRTSIGKITGSAAGIIGSTLAIIGLVAAPLTAGVSIILTAVGSGIGTAGGLANIGATIAYSVLPKKRKKKLEALQKEDSELVKKLSEKRDKFCQALSEIFEKEEIMGVIQNVLKKSIARSDNKEFGEEEEKGLIEAHAYLRRFLNITHKNTGPSEILTEYPANADNSIDAAQTAASTSDHVEAVVSDTDTTVDLRIIAAKTVASDGGHAVKIVAAAADASTSDHVEAVVSDTDTTVDLRVHAAKGVASAGGHAVKIVAAATDATTDLLGSLSASAVPLVKVTAIAGIIVSAITLPIDLYTIIRSSEDLRSKKKHPLANVAVKMKTDMEDDDTDRRDLNNFVDEVKNFIRKHQAGKMGPA